MDKCYNCGSVELKVLDNAISQCSKCGVIFDSVLMKPAGPIRWRMPFKRFLSFPNWRNEDFLLAVAVISMSLSICSTCVLGVLAIYIILLLL